MAIGRIEFDTTGGLQDRMRNIDFVMDKPHVQNVLGDISAERTERIKNSDGVYRASLVIDRIHVQKALGDISAEDFAAFCKNAIVLKMLEAEMFGG